jgi:hypothetical protein
MWDICGDEVFQRLVPDPGVRHQIYKYIAYGFINKEDIDDID